MRYLFCLLPGGNAAEFPQLDRELIKRKVKSHYCECGEGRLYRIHQRELDKLPTDEKGPYLGNATSGHTLYLVSRKMMKRWRQDYGPNPWIPIQ